MNFWKQSPQNIYVAAHRGSSADLPENTMAAFKAAVEAGVDQIETDIRVSKDGELVLIHDATVDRTTNGTGKVHDMTLAELRALDAGKVRGMEGQGHQIPTLKEFMDLVKDHPTMTVDLELKEYPVDGNEEIAYSVCDRVLQMVEDYGFTDRCVINTFSGKLHEYIREKYGSCYRQHVYFPMHYNGECTVDPYSYGYCVCMFGEPYIAPKEECDAMLARGVQPWAGAAIKDAAGVDDAIAHEVFLITCNNPAEILALLRERGHHE